jgi:hypothetical protein
MPVGSPRVDDEDMPDTLVTAIRRYDAALVVAAGFIGAALLAFFGFVGYTGCFIECQPSNANPAAALLIVGALAALPATLVAAARIAAADDYLTRATLATGWLVANGILLAMAANTDLVDLAYPEIDLQIMALVSGVVGAILIAARAAVVPAVVAWILIALASLMWADTIGPISLPITLAALSVPGQVSGTR